MNGAGSAAPAPPPGTFGEEKARDDEAGVTAFFDCATDVMKRYSECMMALDSCEAEGADDCERGFADMLRCPLPSRSVRAGWDACDEEL